MIARLAIIAILAGAILTGYQAFRLSREPLPALPEVRGTGEPAARATAAELGDRARPGPPDVSELVERPPFSPDRRPFQAPVSESGQDGAATDTAEAVAESIRGRLLGVITDGEERFAVLASANSGTTEIVRRGSEIDGWHVEIIDDKRIILRKGATVAEILLFDDR